MHTVAGGRRKSTLIFTFLQNNLRANLKRFAPWHETLFEKDVDLFRFSDSFAP